MSENVQHAINILEKSDDPMAKASISLLKIALEQLKQVPSEISVTTTICGICQKEQDEYIDQAMDEEEAEAMKDQLPEKEYETLARFAEEVEDKEAAEDELYKARQQPLIDQENGIDDSVDITLQVLVTDPVVDPALTTKDKFSLSDVTCKVDGCDLKCWFKSDSKTETYDTCAKHALDCPNRGTSKECMGRKFIPHMHDKRFPKEIIFPLCINCGREENTSDKLCKFKSCRDHALDDNSGVCFYHAKILCKYNCLVYNGSDGKCKGYNNGSGMCDRCN